MYGGHMSNSFPGYLDHQFSTSHNINNQSSDFGRPQIIPDHEIAVLSIQDALMVMNEQQQPQHLHEVSNLSNGSVCSSSYLSSPSSLASYNCSSSMHRSASSHSFQKSGGFNPSVSVSSPTTGGVLSDSDDCSFKCLLSAADMRQGVHVPTHNYRAGNPLSSPKETSLAIIEGMLKAQRYSPEEKRERIERYKNKRNQRNFNKKIQYACRKTLADSRLRIKGRFARNDEVDEIPHKLWSHAAGGDYEDDESFTDDNSWINLLSSFSSNMVP